MPDNETKPPIITVCCSHPEYITPLIFTFAFNGSEYWCPYCGIKEGMLGAGKRIAATPELEKRHELFVLASKEYLNAKSITVCCSTMWEGKEVSPRDLPEHERHRIQSIVDAGFKYKGHPIEQIQIEPPTS